MKGRKHCRKKRKCWCPAFSPFFTMFSKGFYFMVFRRQDCVVKKKVEIQSLSSTVSSSSCKKPYCKHVSIAITDPLLRHYLDYFQPIRSCVTLSFSNLREKAKECS